MGTDHRKVWLVVEESIASFAVLRGEERGREGEVGGAGVGRQHQRAGVC